MSKVTLVDNLSVEDCAMLQALYSRSSEGVEKHLEKVQKAGSGKFMSTYYVGYGHKSIADCGTTTLFIENVSLLAAKAIQDWPLYSGQETSTRYIDMASQPLINPAGVDAGMDILQNWMNFYVAEQDITYLHIREQHPKRDNEDPATYERVVKARTFDVLRGFLPAGICTQLSWHTNLRQAADHLILLLRHPSQEIRELAETLRDKLHEHYPNSGFDRLQKPERAEWEELVATFYTYNWRNDNMFAPLQTLRSTERYQALLEERPPGAVLPHFLSDLGQLTFNFDLDFGSFRDLQRHRNGVCRMPWLTTEIGFHPWYLEQLHPETLKRAVALILKQEQAIKKLSDSKFSQLDPAVAQYYVALGYQVHCSVTYALPAAVYVAELRSSKTVHPTMRAIGQMIATKLKAMLPNMALHADMDIDDWTVRRGLQTLTAKDPQ